MSAQNLKEILAINSEATRLECQRCLKAVDDEPELPDEMPDEMWATIAGDRNAMEEALRIVVRQTKAGIRERILGG